MIIQDRVYGDIEIIEQVLIEIINSPALQRLKDISQHGLPQGYYYRDVFSRYEHSIGVMILLRKLGADIDEQIAGLIHDISHTTFSHAIDWVLGNPQKQDHQDNEFLNYFNNSTIPQILEKFNFSPNLNSFTLLEQPAPNVCADRIDYTLRDMKICGVEDKLIHTILNGLRVYQNRIMFASREVAELFATQYLKFNKEHWMGKNGMFRYQLLANILKEALEKKIIRELRLIPSFSSCF